jgi:hypothetical protein
MMRFSGPLRTGRTSISTLPCPRGCGFTTISRGRAGFSGRGHCTGFVVPTCPQIDLPGCQPTADTSSHRCRATLANIGKNVSFNAASVSPFDLSPKRSRATKSTGRCDRVIERQRCPNCYPSGASLRCDVMDREQPFFVQRGWCKCAGPIKVSIVREQ